MAKQNLPSMLVDIMVFMLDESWGGVVNKLTLPDVEFKTESQTGSGTGGERERMLPILKPLKSKVNFSDFSATIAGLVGNPDGKDEPLIFRGAIDRDGTIGAIKITFQGDWFKLAGGDMSAGGQEAMMEVEASLDIYTLEIDGDEVIHVDIPGKIYRLNGVDQFESIRKALGTA